jgi:hypothetical protein
LELKSRWIHRSAAQNPHKSKARSSVHPDKSVLGEIPPLAGEGASVRDDAGIYWFPDAAVQLQANVRSLAAASPPLRMTTGKNPRFWQTGQKWGTHGFFISSTTSFSSSN